MRWSIRPWRIGQSLCEVGTQLRSRMSRAAVVAVPRKTWPRLSWRMATARDCLSLLIARSTVLSFLYRSSSKPGGRPPREPLRRRAAWLSVFSGIECRIPRRRRDSRQGPLLCPLVGREAVGFRARPARPGPARTDPRNADLHQNHLELGAVRPLSAGDDQGERAAEAVRAEVVFAGAPAPRAAQAFSSCTTSTSRASRLCHGASPWCSAASAPFDAGAGGGSVRAPAAC